MLFILFVFVCCVSIWIIWCLEFNAFIWFAYGTQRMDFFLFALWINVVLTQWLDPLNFRIGPLFPTIRMHKRFFRYCTTFSVRLNGTIFFLQFNRFNACRSAAIITRFIVRWKSIAWLRWQSIAAHAQQTNANIVQTSSIADNEILFCYQSKSRRKRSEAIVTENGPVKKGIAGNKTTTISM